jgi:hypothetical protein
MSAAKLPFSKQIAYAAGMMGWSIMWNIVIVMLPYFYLPPKNSGLVPLVPQLMIFGLFNIMAVILASGRFVDERPALTFYEVGNITRHHILLFNFLPAIPNRKRT